MPILYCTGEATKCRYYWLKQCRFAGACHLQDKKEATPK